MPSEKVPAMIPSEVGAAAGLNGGTEELLTAKEVAELCRVTVRTVRNWVKSGRLQAIRPSAGTLRFKRDDVLRPSPN